MTKNIVAKIIFIIGILQMILGVVFGLELSTTRFSTDLIILFSWVIGGFISGMVFIGLAEIIKLLHTINGKISSPEGQEKNKRTTEYLDTFNQLSEKNEAINWTLQVPDTEKIHELYANESIIEIIPSKLEGYCLVKLQNTHGQYISIVDVNGFGAQEIHDEETKQVIMDWYNG